MRGCSSYIDRIYYTFKAIFINMLSNINNSFLSPLAFEIFKFLTIDKTVPCLLPAARALVLHFQVL